MWEMKLLFNLALALHCISELCVCPVYFIPSGSRPVSVPKGGSQSAPRFRLIESKNLRQQSLKYANSPLSGEDWETGVVCSLCTEPWDDSQLKPFLCLLPSH